MISTTQGQKEAFLQRDMGRSCTFLFNYLTLHLIKTSPRTFFSTMASNLISTYVSFTPFPSPSHTHSVCCYFIFSCSAFLYPPLPSSFLHHRQWYLVNITLIHSSFKCRHYGYQMHLWLFRPIDWHNQYIILGKFGDTTLELADALRALSSNLYGDGASSLS